MPSSMSQSSSTIEESSLVVSLVVVCGAVVVFEPICKSNDVVKSSASFT